MALSGVQQLADGFGVSVGPADPPTVDQPGFGDRKNAQQGGEWSWFKWRRLENWKGFDATTSIMRFSATLIFSTRTQLAGTNHSLASFPSQFHITTVYLDTCLCSSIHQQNHRLQSPIQHTNQRHDSDKEQPPLVQA
jgi:hypothetical protein